MGDRLSTTLRFGGDRLAKRAEQLAEVESGFGRCFEVAFMTRQTHTSLFSAFG